MELKDPEKTREALANSIVDGMDHKDMYQCVYDMVSENLKQMSDPELLEELDMQCIDETDHVCN